MFYKNEVTTHEDNRYKSKMMTQGQKLSTEKATGFHTNPFRPQEYCIVRPAWGGGRGLPAVTFL